MAPWAQGPVLACYWSKTVKVTHSLRRLVSNSLQPHGLYSPWSSPGQNTGVGSISFLQGIFPTQGSHPCLPHCRRILYQLSHQGSPRILEWVVYPFSRGSSQPRSRTGVSYIMGRFFTNWATREARMVLSKTLTSFLYMWVSSFNNSICWKESESEVAQSCPTLCDSKDCSLPGFSVHGIFQARILEWVAISFSSVSSQPRKQTWVSCIEGRFFTNWATREARLALLF